MYHSIIDFSTQLCVDGFVQAWKTRPTAAHARSLSLPAYALMQMLNAYFHLCTYVCTYINGNRCINHINKTINGKNLNKYSYTQKS